MYRLCELPKVIKCISSRAKKQTCKNLSCRLFSVNSTNPDCVYISRDMISDINCYCELAITSQLTFIPLCIFLHLIWPGSSY